MKNNLLKIRIPMLIANIIISISMIIGLCFSIGEGSTEKIIGSSIVLMLSVIAIITFLITRKSSLDN